MNPKRLAQLTCANWKSDGICAGVQIRKDLSLFADPELNGKICCVNEKRCSYFERFIIPEVTNLMDERGWPQLQQMKKAVAKYQFQVMNLSKDLRRCKRCKRPTPGMKPNEKFCQTCKAIRIAESKRDYKRRSRGEKARS